MKIASSSRAPPRSPARLRAWRCAGIALLVLVLRQHAAAQSGALEPTPDAPNQVQFTVTYDVYAPHDWTSALSQRSWVAFAYDPLVHRLEVRDLHLFPDDVPLWCFGFHACFGYCAIDIALDPAVPPPVAALSPEGHLSLTIPVQMTYRPAFATVRCDQSWVETDPGTLSMTGTFRYDAATGEVSLADFLGSGEWGIVGGLAHLEVTSNFGGFTPVLDSLPDPVRVGAAIELSGAGISPGSLLKVFVATSSGVVDVLPSGLAPTATSATTWTGTLPWPWPVPSPDATLLGNGFASLLLVRPDSGYDTSNARGAVLLGSAAVGVPSVTSVNGVALSPSSSDLTIGAAHVGALVEPGQNLAIGGDGFSNAVVNLFTAGGNAGPLGPSSQTATSIEVAVPAQVPVGPGAIQVVNVPSFLASNAVSVPIGALVTVAGVSILGDTVTVTGTGFCDVTVINLFAHVGDVVVNAGGLNADGSPVLALTIDGPTRLHFTRPSGLDAGPAYVMAINPPFISGSGDGPAGAFVLP